MEKTHIHKLLGSNLESQDKIDMATAVTLFKLYKLKRGTKDTLQ